MQVTAIIPTLHNQSGLKRLMNELDLIHIPAVVINNQETNLGFAKAVNAGAKRAKTEWLLILNDDVEGISYQSIQRLIDQAINNNWVAVTPKLINPKGEIENIGYRVLPVGKVALNFDASNNTDRELDGLTAACLLINRQVFEKLHGFDESFFAYLEDVDLFLRLKTAGYHFGVVPEVQVIHDHMATSKTMGNFKARQDLVNWWRMVVKHPKKFILSPTLPSMLIERGRNVSGWIKANG